MDDAGTRQIDDVESGVDQPQAVAFFLAVEMEGFRIAAELEKHAPAQQMREPDERRDQARVIDRRRLHPGVPRPAVDRRHRKRDRADARVIVDERKRFEDARAFEEPRIIVHQKDVLGGRLTHDAVARDDVAFVIGLADGAHPARHRWRDLADRGVDRNVARVVDHDHLREKVGDQRQRRETTPQRVGTVLRDNADGQACHRAKPFSARPYTFKVSRAVRVQLISRTR